MDVNGRVKDSRLISIEALFAASSLKSLMDAAASKGGLPQLQRLFRCFVFHEFPLACASESRAQDRRMDGGMRDHKVSMKIMRMVLRRSEKHFPARWCCNPCRISDARWISGAGVDRTSNTAGNGATICVEQMMQKDQKLRDVEFIQWCWEVLQGVEICLCRHRAKRALMPGWLQPFPSCKTRRLADAGPLGHQCEGHVRIIHPISLSIIINQYQIYQPESASFPTTSYTFQSALKQLISFQMWQANGQVVFGVSTAGDIEHATGVLHVWLPNTAHRYSPESSITGLWLEVIGCWCLLCISICAHIHIQYIYIYNYTYICIQNDCVCVRCICLLLLFVR